jgi:hypothetical protein
MIEVRIHPEIFAMMTLRSKFEWETFCMARLRRAGIPVLGTLLFRGVESGTLTKIQDFDTNDIVYRWQ